MDHGFKNMDLQDMPLACPLQGKLVAGISGGADSVFLFHLLLSLQGKGQLTFETVHVNHGIRGQSADEDEAFVRALCLEHEVPFHVYHACLGPDTDENTAREARYGFLRDAVHASGADALVLAHHMDDQAETFLLHLLRGAGPVGLGGMRPETESHGIRILRPLLCLRRDTLRQSLTERGLSWREDESNTDARYARNALRMELIPGMEQRFPGAVNHIARAAELIRAENDATGERAEEFLRIHAGRDWLETEPLAGMNEADRRTVLRLWWNRSFGAGLDERNLSYEQTLELEGLAIGQDKGRVNLPAGMTAERGKHHLHLTGHAKPALVETPYDPRGVTVGELKLRTAVNGTGFGNGTDTQAFPKDFLEGTVLRGRRIGDRITPFGSEGSQKLQDYLVNRGVDAPWRDQIPLLCRDQEVLWVAGVGTGKIPRVNAETQTVRLSWTGPMPWMKNGTKI